MPRKRLTIVSCSVYAPELTNLSVSGRLPYPIRFADSALHMNPDNLQSRLHVIIREERARGHYVVLLYGDCASSMSSLTSQDGVFRVKGNNCGDIFLGKDHYKTLMKEGALLLFPEWTERWEQILLNFPGMDEELAYKMIREMHSKFVYVNTGLRPVPYDKIKSCSDFFELPYEIISINVEHLEMLISEAIALVPEEETIPEPEESKEAPTSEEMSVRDRGSTALMLLDITTSVLMSPDDIQVIASNLSQKLRELSGAQTSALIMMEKNRCDDEMGALQSVLSVSPPRRSYLIQSPEAALLIKNAFSLSRASLVHAPDGDESYSARALYPCLVLPLYSGSKQIGVSLFMGLIDETFADLLLEIHDVLSNVVGVILNNAMMMESQSDILVDLKHEIDIRKAAEESLKQERQRMSYVLEGTNVGIWEINFQTGDMITNLQDAKLLGYTHRPIMKSHEWEKNIHPDDIPLRDRALEQHLSGEQDFYNCEFRIQRDDGTYIWVLSKGKVLDWGIDDSPIVIYGIHMDVTERRTAVERAFFLANHDALTGLPNIRLARDRLATALYYSRRHATIGAVLFIDLDNFKQFNDAYGHDVGDQVLQKIASRLSSCIREMDTVARFGGDEFLVILSELQEAEEAELIASRIAQTIAQPILTDDIIRKNTPDHLGASIGIALFPGDSENGEELIRMADEAMYVVKKSGKGGYRFAFKGTDTLKIQ